MEKLVALSNGDTQNSKDCQVYSENRNSSIYPVVGGMEAVEMSRKKLWNNNCFLVMNLVL